MSGVGGAALALGDGVYVAHAQEVSEKIDWVASSQDGVKVAPYIDKAPYLVSSTGSNIGDTVTMGLHFNIPVTVSGGPPQLQFTVNGVARTASLSAGSGSNVLQFTYQLQASDGSGDAIIVTGLTLNGASVTGDGKEAVTTLPSSTPLVLSGPVSGSSLVTDFINNIYKMNGISYASFLSLPGASFARNSVGTYFDASGVLQTAANDQMRFDHDPVTHEAKGLLVEEQRTNYLRNSTMQGAVIGGAQPNNWSFSGASNGLTRIISGVGVEDGMNYVDLHIYGTPTATSGSGWYMDSTQYIPASAGQNWTASLYAKLVGGSLTNIVNIFISINERDTGGTGVAGYTQIFTPTATTQRVTKTVQMSAAPLLAYVTSGIGINYTNGQPVDITIRVYGNQLELGSYASSFIPTSGSQVIREADLANINVGSWYNAAASTFAISAATTYAAAGAALGEMSIGEAGGDRITMYKGSAGNAGFYVVAGSVQQLNTSKGNILDNVEYKKAMSYNNSGHVSIVRNGFANTEYTGLTIPTPLNKLRIGNVLSSSYFNGYIKRLDYYPAYQTGSDIESLVQ
ncbi:MAG: hypothetical protein LRY36_00025 [Alphaproteobacteria bacterium]|nr:hypothetical protein [Alphaproteobacteria bacterium]